MSRSASTSFTSAIRRNGSAANQARANPRRNSRCRKGRQAHRPYSIVLACHIVLQEPRCAHRSIGSVRIRRWSCCEPSPPPETSTRVPDPTRSSCNSRSIGQRSRDRGIVGRRGGHTATRSVLAQPTRTAAVHRQPRSVPPRHRGEVADIIAVAELDSESEDRHSSGNHRLH